MLREVRGDPTRRPEASPARREAAMAQGAPVEPLPLATESLGHHEEHAILRFRLFLSCGPSRRAQRILAEHPAEMIEKTYPVRVAGAGGRIHSVTGGLTRWR